MDRGCYHIYEMGEWLGKMEEWLSDQKTMEYYNMIIYMMNHTWADSHQKSPTTMKIKNMGQATEQVSAPA